jgi:hypothetical protein
MFSQALNQDESLLMQENNGFYTQVLELPSPAFYNHMPLATVRDLYRTAFEKCKVERITRAYIEVLGKWRIALELAEESG